MEYSIATLLSQASATRSLKGVVGMTTTEQRIAIEIGPNLKELLYAFIHAYDEHPPRARFTVALINTREGVRDETIGWGELTVSIVGLMHLGDDSQNFLVYAYTSLEGFKGELVEIYYDPRLCTGYLKVAAP